jgi:hypothetical protein
VITGPVDYRGGSHCPDDESNSMDASISAADSNWIEAETRGCARSWGEGSVGTIGMLVCGRRSWVNLRRIGRIAFFSAEPVKGVL